jgi:hypothetical protein
LLVAVVQEVPFLVEVELVDIRKTFQLISLFRHQQITQLL